MWNSKKQIISDNDNIIKIMIFLLSEEIKRYFSPAIQDFENAICRIYFFVPSVLTLVTPLVFSTSQICTGISKYIGRYFKDL